jgi:hypothetical protein
MLRQRWKIFTWAGAILWFLTSQPSSACTLWGASGTAVEGGGTLVAKNRDWSPDHHQELVVLKPTQGYRALLLKAVGGAEPGVKAGVNEKGLVIVSATASQVDGRQRTANRQKRDLMSHFLSACADIDELLGKIELLRRPVFYLVGDRNQIALIEVAPDGRRSVRRQAAGTLHHTNHYCAFDPPPDPKRKIGTSSTQRSARIGELLKDSPAPFTMDDFIRFSTDEVAGPDNSIWRTGSGPSHKRTLATWLVSVPTGGSPQLYLKTADPGEPERVCRISIEAALGGDDRDRIPLDSELCR